MAGLRSCGNRRRGSVIPLVAVLLPALIGVLAISLELGMAMDSRRKSQVAADLAALAGATDVFNNYNSYRNNGYYANQVVKSALTNAAANGFTNDKSTTVTVNVYNENQAPYATLEGGQWQTRPPPPNYVYVEVIISSQQPRFFSAIFGNAPLPITARAVARTSFSYAEPGIIVLDPVDKASLNVTGNGGVVVTGNGSVIVDSSNAEGGVTTGSGGIAASGFYFTGTPGWNSTSSGTFTNVGTGQFDSSIINSGVPPTPDPLAGLPVPAMPPTAVLPDGSMATKTVNWSGNNQYGASGGILTLSPGTYNGGVSVSGGSQLVLQPGIYYMNGGGFGNSGSASISVSGPPSPDTGTGVMIYNNPLQSSDQIKITGNGSTTIPAPDIGTYKGISIFQNRTSDATVAITGNGSMNIQGTFYAARGTLNITGNGGTSSGIPIDKIGAQYVSYQLVITGNGGFQIQYGGGNAINVRTIQLVE
jgi:hypothetical protein